MEKYDKPYDPVLAEKKAQDAWDKAGYFNPDNLPKTEDRFKEPFSIVLPPPNVTGILHMGSAFMIALEDIMVRYARMSGKKTLWIPGTDHAAIATQSKVEKEIQKNEGKSRHDLGREELLKRIDTFAKESHDAIVNQIKTLGASVDWSREAFTLDEKRNLAVRTAFKKMYDDGLIYRGYRVVNWDPKGQTTISDDEIVYEERKAVLYTFKYSKDFPISISTTRPETKVGDVAVAVNPEDERYEKYVGKEYDIDFAGEKIHIKIIADKSVEKDFGTGALGVTPAHSMIDYEIAQRHNLPIKPVINEYAKMLAGNENIKNKKTSEAKLAVVEWLKSENLLEKEEEVNQNISTAERTGGIVEPLPKLQWFIAVNKEFERDGKKTTLKKLMVDSVNKENITILPERYERVYQNWINNLQDWCISRQIWYGHRIPVWYRGEEIFCGIETPNGDGWKQDEDTLDTWFSSGLWTFSTLGWPDEKEFSKMRDFHPTTILETGYDIIFFWVARMILMSKYLLNEIPFKTVYLHGIVRDEKGRKISKSLGNNIDPVDMAKKYGADAVRMSLVVGVGPGNDSKVGEDKIKAYKNFANKIWNVTRFIYSNTNEYDKAFSKFSEIDKQIKAEFDTLLTEITKEMNEFKYYLVAEKLYSYTWHILADKIIEESKDIIKNQNTEEEKVKSESRKQLLLYIHENLLISLHPFMPHLTEEIWSTRHNSQLCIHPWVL